MILFYVMRILDKKMEIEDVPLRWRLSVEKMLKEREEL